MSVIEDFRKVIQDFLAPELRSINVRLDAVNERIASLHREMQLNHTVVMSALNLDKRMALIEDRLERDPKPTDTKTN